MSTVAASGLLELEATPSIQGLHIVSPASEPVYRRGSPEQGRALEMLGHAVEYLVDSRLFQTGDHVQRDEQEAVQILMRLSRAVFSECPEVVSLRKRLRRWLGERVLRESRVA